MYFHINLFLLLNTSFRQIFTSETVRLLSQNYLHWLISCVILLLSNYLGFRKWIFWLINYQVSFLRTENVAHSLPSIYPMLLCYRGSQTNADPSNVRKKWGQCLLKVWSGIQSWSPTPEGLTFRLDDWAPPNPAVVDRGSLDWGPELMILMTPLPKVIFKSIKIQKPLLGIKNS